MEIKIRKATSNDLNIIKEFQNQLVEYERPFDSTIPKQGLVEYYNLQLLIESEKVNFLVVEVNEKIIGCGFGEIRSDIEWSSNSLIGYIGLFFIEKEFRNKGISGLIFKELIKWFKENNIKDIRLKVYSENEKAVNAYKKYGFKGHMLEMRYEIE